MTTVFRRLLAHPQALLLPFVLGTGILAPTAHAQSVAAATSAAAKARLTVTAGLAQRADWPQVISASGAVVAWHEAQVSARSSGLALVDVLADRGTRVRRGQVLARFDDRTPRAELAQADASLAQAQANAQQAVLNRDRTLSLRSSGAVSEQDELQAVTSAATALAQRDQAKASVDAARVRLDHTVVTAPDNGTISSRSATLGQVASSGQELFRLIRQDRLEWRAEVPPQQLAALQPGQAAEVTLPDGRTWGGKVRLVNPALDGASRLALVSVDLAPGSSARASMYLQGRLLVGRAAAVVVPAESIVLRDGRAYAFLLKGERARRVAVTTGRREGALVEVLQGVPEGSTVVVRGAGFLSDGDTVQISRADTVAGPLKKPLT